MGTVPAYAADHLLQHPGAWAHARRILERAGVPLEIKVRSICKKFADEARTRLGLRGFPAADRLIYGDLNGSAPLREVDQLVRYYDEISLADDLYGLSMGASVAIECKRREGVAFFGIRRYVKEGHLEGLSTIPLAADLAGSQVVADCLARDPEFLSETPYADIVGMRIDAANGPQELDKEQLVYKASASLYDYIQQEWHEESGAYPDELRDSGILEDADIDYKRPFYLDWRYWLEKVPVDAYDKFNAHIFQGDGTMHFSADHGVAVICTDSPLYDVGIADDGSLEAPAAARWLRTSGRYHVGMTQVRGALARPTPELDSFVVHVDHLREFLEGVLDWQGEQRTRLQELPAEVVARGPLEASLRGLVASLLDDEDRLYTSEFDTWD